MSTHASRPLSHNVVHTQKGCVVTALVKKVKRGFQSQRVDFQIPASDFKVFFKFRAEGGKMLH